MHLLVHLISLLCVCSAVPIERSHYDGDGDMDSPTEMGERSHYDRNGDMDTCFGFPRSPLKSIIVNGGVGLFMGYIGPVVGLLALAVFPQRTIKTLALSITHPREASAAYLKDFKDQYRECPEFMMGY
jgi:hypothetical protein